MNPQCASPTFSQYCEISASLRGFDDAEGVLLIRHRQIERIVASNLQEHSGIRPTLVGLAGRMQKARTKAQTSRHALSISNQMPRRLKYLFVLFIHLDVCEQRKVITRL